MTDTKPGVQFTRPPDALIPDLRASLQRAIATLPEGKSGALVAVATEAGVNAAIVAKVQGDWELQAWIGKSWKGNVAYGATVMKSW